MNLHIEIPETHSGRPLHEHSHDDRHVMIQYPFYQPVAAKNRVRRYQAIRSVAGDPTRHVLLDRERVGIVGSEWKFVRTGDREELYRVGPTLGEPENEIEAKPEVAARIAVGQPFMVDAQQMKDRGL